jgi:hypothetical protein
VRSDACVERKRLRKLEPKTEDQMADDFRRDDCLAMIIASDSQTNTGQPIIANDNQLQLTELRTMFLP